MAAVSLECDKSLFFLRFSESNARARERRSRETHETRAAAREKKRDCPLFRASPVSRYQSRAWPFACLAFCSTDYRKKRDCPQSTVSLLWNTNTKAVTSCENALHLKATRAVPGKVRHRVVCRQFNAEYFTFNVNSFLCSKSLSGTQNTVKFKSTCPPREKSCDCYHWTWPVMKF